MRGAGPAPGRPHGAWKGRGVRGYQFEVSLPEAMGGFPRGSGVRRGPEMGGGGTTEGHRGGRGISEDPLTGGCGFGGPQRAWGVVVRGFSSWGDPEGMKGGKEGLWGA